MHNATKMMSRELPTLASAIGKTLDDNAGYEVPFLLFVFAPERLEFISSVERDGCLSILEKWLAFVRSSERPTIPLTDRDLQVIACTKPICEFIQEALAIITGNSMTFALIMSVKGSVTYGSTANRDAVFNVLSEFAKDLRQGDELEPPAYKLAMH